jgi:cellulose synthase/poly-beta-1,6-N-acetylglucosamine synthase-like glycosyltransferase
MTLIDAFQYLLLVLLITLVVPAGYLLVLTFSALFARSQTPENTHSDKQRFVFLIPAHNEEKLLPECLASIGRLDYPADRYSVLVVADNCTDKTAAIARRYGAMVIDRYNQVHRGKGYALEFGLAWLREHIFHAHAGSFSIVIIDADTTVSENFLRVMDSRIAAGERVIQAYYTVRNAERSWSENMRYVALTVIHYLRPQARMVLGGSAGLKGNGMVFSADVLQRHAWTASLTEDIEYHMALLLDGQRVTFAPDAVVYGEMPENLTQARSQVDRWEQGRLQMAGRYTMLLIQAAGKELLQGHLKRVFVLLDSAMELLIPPFSILVGLAFVGLAAAGGLFAVLKIFTPLEMSAGLAGLNISIAAGVVVALLMYLLIGLKLAKAPASAYRTLAYAPLFIVWKGQRYFNVLLKRNQQEWVRTTRNGG